MFHLKTLLGYWTSSISPQMLKLQTVLKTYQQSKARNTFTNFSNSAFNSGGKYQRLEHETCSQSWPTVFLSLDSMYVKRSCLTPGVSGGNEPKVKSILCMIFNGKLSAESRKPQNSSDTHKATQSRVIKYVLFIIAERKSHLVW